MKKLLAMICILGTAVALSACATQGKSSSDEAAYATSDEAGASGDQVFHARQVK